MNYCTCVSSILCPWWCSGLRAGLYPVRIRTPSASRTGENPFRPCHQFPWKKFQTFLIWFLFLSCEITVLTLKIIWFLSCFQIWPSRASDSASWWWSSFTDNPAFCTGLSQKDDKGMKRNFFEYLKDKTNPNLVTCESKCAHVSMTEGGRITCISFAKTIYQSLEAANHTMLNAELSRCIIWIKHFSEETAERCV